MKQVLALLPTVSSKQRPGFCGSTLRMKTFLFFFAMVAGRAATIGEKAKDVVTITTTPPGATVEWNRKVIGVTPLTYKVGEYAFNARKSTLFSKRLINP
jgi:hypothetical protein